MLEMESGWIYAIRTKQVGRTDLQPPEAPKQKLATMPARHRRYPPGGRDWTFTASTNCGTSAIVPTCPRRNMLCVENIALWPTSLKTRGRQVGGVPPILHPKPIVASSKQRWPEDTILAPVCPSAAESRFLSGRTEMEAELILRGTPITRFPAIFSPPRELGWCSEREYCYQDPVRRSSPSKRCLQPHFAERGRPFPRAAVTEEVCIDGGAMSFGGWLFKLPYRRLLFHVSQGSKQVTRAPSRL